MQNLGQPSRADSHFLGESGSVQTSVGFEPFFPLDCQLQEDPGRRWPGQSDPGSGSFLKFSIGENVLLALPDVENTERKLV